MSREQFYQVWGRLSKQFPCLSKPLLTGLTLLVLGIIRAEASTLTKIAEALPQWGKPDTLERRLQRWLDNDRVGIGACQACWISWLLATYGRRRLILLVDETKLGQHLSVMVVGLPCYGRCLPLVWGCYVPGQTTGEGQVARIVRLLGQIRAVAGATISPLVEADRGIGTSPDLLRAIAGLGWRYLVRVQNDSRVQVGHVQRGKRRVACWRKAGDLVQAGQHWRGAGVVFKKRGKLSAYVHVLWRWGEKEAWCLVTNDPILRGEVYAVRNWQEQGFRDLKRGGWHWNRSQVWQVAHAERLLLALVVSYSWMMSLGTALFTASERSTVTRGRRQRFSQFRLGLRWLKQCWAQGTTPALGLRFCPEPMLC